MEFKSADVPTGALGFVWSTSATGLRRRSRPRYATYAPLAVVLAVALLVANLAGIALRLDAPLAG